MLSVYGMTCDMKSVGRVTVLCVRMWNDVPMGTPSLS